MTGIGFRRDMDFEYGRCDVVAPGVRRVIANNPGPFTYTGTGVYIIGTGNVAVIDPGPALPDHKAALDAAMAGERITHVFVTHHHLDHTPLARPLAADHGCQVYGFGPPINGASGGDGDVRLDAGNDMDFAPDVRFAHGEVIAGDGWALEAIHTPGHTSNHMCYALKDPHILFCGDHVMAWSTSVVSPPDGDMGDYLNSLEMIRQRGFAQLWPTHGPAVDDPDDFISQYITHRRARETQILEQLAAGHRTIPDMVRAIYADVDPRLHPAAAHSVLAHLIHLVEQGRVRCDHGSPSLSCLYAPVRPLR